MVVSQSEQDIKDYVRRSLGDGVVAVELTDLQVQDAVDSAAMLYHQMIGDYNFSTINVSGPGEYTMPPSCTMVVEVFFDLSGSGL